VPIVFEEVTGEIAPERERRGAEREPEEPQGGEHITETIRREMQLMLERQCRLRAD